MGENADNFAVQDGGRQGMQNKQSESMSVKGLQVIEELLRYIGVQQKYDTKW